VGTSHCGAGCTLADIVTEFTLYGLGVTLLGSALWASYAWDFAAAWLLGIVFQYYSIKPMRNLSPGKGVVAAIKADTLSIIAFQVGMYGWMALVHFVLFTNPHLKPIQPEYWLMMQVGMVFGFATSFPMNRWLIQRGLKERMG
jgi:putative flippase GtrA